MTKRGNHRSWRFLAPAAFFSLTVACMAAAYWEQKQDTVNVLTIASYEVHIEEEYETPQSVFPSQTIDKKVNIQNSGTADALVRVSLKKMFGTATGDDFIEDESLSTDVIKVQCNDRYWKQDTDGWYYYMEVLKAGEKTREPLMESFCLESPAGNAYKGKEGRIVVTMESLQADKTAARTWNIDTKEIRTTWEGEALGQETAVNYEGKNRGFSVEANETDLFASFKDLTPGCGRVQTIRLRNRSQEEVEIFLRAQEMAQKEQSEKVQKILTTYATIQIKEKDKVLYRGPVCGNGKASSMTQDISLGRFSANSAKDLTVTLSLSPEIEKDMQHLSAQVKWVFSAKGEDGAVVQQAVPVTGDPKETRGWILLMTVSGIAFLATLLYEMDRRKRRRP